MMDSVTIRMIIGIYKKLAFYYENSGFARIMHRLGKGFGKGASGSSILGFFNKEWNIGRAWKESFTFRILILPLKLLAYASDKLSDRTNSILEGSGSVRGIKAFLRDLFNMSSRVYGLLFITFALTQGLLSLLLDNGGALFDMKGIIRLVLFLAGTLMILIDRPVKGLMEGSVLGRIMRDFFLV